MTDDLAVLDATAQAVLVRDGTVSPRELVDAALARIDAVNSAAQRGDPPARRPRRVPKPTPHPTARSAACRSW